MVEFYTGLKEQYNSETYAESIYQCTDTNETYVFGQKVNDVVNISNTSTDLNTLIPESGIIYYYCENSAASQSLVNTPIKGGFILSCQRLVSSIVFQDFYSYSSSANSKYHFQRHYDSTTQSWSDWESVVEFYPLFYREHTAVDKRIALTSECCGLKLGSGVGPDCTLDTIYGEYLTDKVSAGYIFNTKLTSNLHLSGTANTTVYTIVSPSSVGYWFANNKLSDFFTAGRKIINVEDNLVAKIVSFDPETKELTLDKTLNPNSDWNDYTVGMGAYTSRGYVLGGSSVANQYSMTGVESLATDIGLAFGDRCAAVGTNAVALNWQTIAQNTNETAIGISNKSHMGSTTSQQTLFSVGNGTYYFNDWSSAKQCNALEVMKNGDVYVQGIGNYDGINDSFTAETLQSVIQKSSKLLKGTINITNSTAATLMAERYAALNNGELEFYIIADSSGNIPSSESYVTATSSVALLFGKSQLGASVGDLLIISKLNSLPVYKIMPLNDAKAANGNFPGADGLETIWDKQQINLIPGIQSTVNSHSGSISAMDQPTRGETNMNNCLQTGFYPWCTLGRPSGATGAFSLVVQRSTTADSSGYYTVQQTCYGRETELGQVWSRFVFTKSDGTSDYMDWIRVDRPTTNIWTGNQVAYDQIETKDSNTLYFITA